MPRDRVVRAVLTLTLSLALLAGMARPGQAKEYELDGIVDCGRAHGDHCTIDDVLYLRTEQVTGELSRVKIQVSWIRQHLPRIEQDDRILLLVEDYSGGIRALSVAEVHEVDGTINPGLSSGNRLVAEQPKPKREDDHKNDPGVGVITVTPPGTPPGPPGPPPPPIDFTNFSGSCTNRTGGADCNISATGLVQGQVGGTPQIRISTKTSSSAAAVDEFRSCSPITPSLTTTCNVTLFGLVYEGGSVQLTYPLAGGGTNSSVVGFFQCVAQRAPGEVC
jgi:hypothetical protein